MFYFIYINNKNDYIKLKNIERINNSSILNNEYDNLCKVKFSSISNIRKLMILDCCLII